MGFMSPIQRGRRVDSVVRPRRLVLFTAALLVGCGNGDPGRTSPLEPVTAQPTIVAERPFTFVLDGQANPDFSQGPCSVVNQEAGTGIALHVGQVTWASRETVSFCVDPDDPGLGEVTGEWAITAANGDMLNGTYRTLVRADFAAGSLAADGTYAVSGGTGRFTDAAGGGRVSVTGSLTPPFAVSGSFVGSIVY